MVFKMFRVSFKIILKSLSVIGLYYIGNFLQKVLIHLRVYLTSIEILFDCRQCLLYSGWGIIGHCVQYIEEDFEN
jgi:hypothetical protein